MREKNKVTTLVTSHEPKQNKTFLCKVCQKPHGLWSCDRFRHMSVASRWDVARQNKVCFRCLGDTHFGSDCPRSRICGINSCKSFHHRLLHENKPDVKPVGESQDRQESSQQPEQKVITPDKTPIAMMTCSPERPQIVAMRTIPVVVSNEKTEITIYALLDEASSRTYLNRDDAGQ